VAAVHRLLDECRELGADARVWQQHMLDGLRWMTGSWVGGNIEVRPTRNRMASDWATQVDVGWTDSERQRAAAVLTSGEFPPDEFCLRLARAFAGGRAEELTRSRQQLIDDSEWFRSATCDAYRYAGSGDIVMSLARIPGRDSTLCVGFIRAVGDRLIGRREAAVVELFCRLAQPHLGGGLALCGEPGVSELSPRRRQVLAGLLDGLAEKQIAGKLGLSLPTVHEHVTDLYRHFGVGSRGELLGLFLRRRNGPARDWLERFRLDEPGGNGTATG
jgi:DNA-binding CsgD family transcriptional regulator